MPIFNVVCPSCNNERKLFREELPPRNWICGWCVQLRAGHARSQNLMPNSRKRKPRPRKPQVVQVKGATPKYVGKNKRVRDPKDSAQVV